MREVNGSEYALSVLGPARRIEWEGDFPADLRALVEPVFVPLEALLPTWCQTFVLRNIPTLEKTLQIEISVRNRWAMLRVGPSWFAVTAEERRNSIVHEIYHVLFEPFQWNAARALDAYGPAEGSAERNFLNQMLTDGMEQAVEDMARSILRLLPPV
jgi:hypothetical protein